MKGKGRGGGGRGATFGGPAAAPACRPPAGQCRTGVTLHQGIEKAELPHFWYVGRMFISVNQ